MSPGHRAGAAESAGARPVLGRPVSRSDPAYVRLDHAERELGPGRSRGHGELLEPTGARGESRSKYSK